MNSNRKRIHLFDDQSRLIRAAVNVASAGLWRPPGAGEASASGYRHPDSWIPPKTLFFFLPLQRFFFFFPRSLPLLELTRPASSASSCCSAGALLSAVCSFPASSFVLFLFMADVLILQIRIDLFQLPRDQVSLNFYFSFHEKRRSGYKFWLVALNLQYLNLIMYISLYIWPNINSL